MDVSPLVTATPDTREHTMTGQPEAGSWWEWRDGFGWVEREPVPEPAAETGEESAA